MRVASRCAATLSLEAPLYELCALLPHWHAAISSGAVRRDKHRLLLTNWESVAPAAGRALDFNRPR